MSIVATQQYDDLQCFSDSPDSASFLTMNTEHVVPTV